MSLLLFALSYGGIDRLWGSDVRHARWMCLGLLPAIGYILGGFYGLTIAIAFLFVRSLAFRLFDGSATPANATEKRGLLVRYGLMVPIATVLALLFGKDPLAAALAWGLWAFAALQISAWYGRENEAAIKEDRELDPSLNTWVEFIRGALAGFAAGVS